MHASRWGKSQPVPSSDIDTYCRGMKRITYVDTSVLVGDAAADTLLEYAATLARHHSADALELEALGSDGDGITATFLLDSGASLLAASSRSLLPEPDNSIAIHYMRERIELIGKPARGFSTGFTDHPDYGALD